MNIERGQESFSDEEIQDLRERALALKEERSLSWVALSKMMGIPSGTLSPWCTGSYGGDNNRIALEVNKFFRADENRRELAIDAPDVPDFLPTPTSRRIMQLLQWAHRGEIVVITGEAGVGKTKALTQYQAITPNTVRVAMSEGTASPTSMLTEILRRIGSSSYKSGGMGGVQALTNLLIERINGARYLLMLDEAQYLSDRALNQLRYLHDECGVGLALVGNLDIMGRIAARSGAGSAPFAQLHSRVSMQHHFERPVAGDIEVLLNAWGVAHADEKTLLAKIANQPGCLRQVTQTLKAATLVARQGDEPRTLSHLQAAFHQARPLAVRAA
jgi:DNA transposition AAA+ family ATPase